MDTHTLSIPIKDMRSQWVSGRLLCYAEVGAAPASSMEIPGVDTVLVLCDRGDCFRSFFQGKSPDEAHGWWVAFGQTRYVLASDPRHGARGCHPDRTRYAVLEPFFAIGEMQHWVAPFFERVYLEDDVRPTQLTGMRVDRMIIDDPIAMHDSSEYLEAMARCQQMIVDASHIPASVLHNIGIDIPSTPRGSNSFVAGWLDRQTEALGLKGKGIGNTSCKFNARDRHLRCAVNPCGPCEGCAEFEPLN